ncbi:inverse autotransporter beta domain-containing protein [Xenorhabdus sp. VLS]|uniref:Inverse autotransporter beta domain-containing protein n=1 Tax=Xenorhabdus lircayensis TaxID=2763499 RepID=A0ABS0U4A8_9GAMM|nr:inverse autotransporter beta domain-containing protein [Xenorhabdus lircayensis]MBI6548319.1 inverse autotransporter beta domain-containing protein [Xenorhabdus lircayensis]
MSWIEAWRDNLKLSANLYQRLSGWKASRQVTDYDVRPANGWDVRVEGGLLASYLVTYALNAIYNRTRTDR